MLQWKELTLEDKALIDRFYAREPVRTCEFTFTNNYLWKPYYDIRYAIVEDSLVFCSTGRELSVSFPIGAPNLKAAIETLDAWFREQDKGLRMHLVSREQFEALEQLWPGRFSIEYDRDNADYVYDRKQLQTLSGKSMQGKRNHCNKFKNMYPDWSYEAITTENTEECRRMAQEWWRVNDDHAGGEKSEEIEVTLAALDSMEALGLTGGLLRAEGRVVAFSIGEPCGEDMFVVHFEKAFSDVPGAYSMINQQFVEHEMTAYTFVNREDDAGSEGLRKAKLSYHPAFLMEMGLVTEVNG